MENKFSSSPTFMLVDDSTLDLYINHFIIKEYGNGNKVLEFSMATDALQFLEANKDQIENIPDIILLDINMPIMNGFEFIDEFAKLPESIIAKSRIYILSSSLDPKDIKKSEDSPYVISFIEKPISEEIVKSIIEDFNQ